MESEPQLLPRTALAWVPHWWRTVLFPPTAIPSSHGHWLHTLLVVLLPAVMLYPTLGFHLLEPDEGRYAQIPREMHDRGEWVVPTLQGEAYLDKPPLMYWLVNLSYRAFGVNEAAARLVPAVCVHLTILAVYFLGRRSIGARAALWAAILLSVAPGFMGIARLLLLDGLLTLCVTLSVLCGYEAVRLSTFQWRWWLAAALASGLGFLTKGPISEVLLFPPLFAIAWLSGTMARVSPRNVVLFGLIVLGVNLPWYIAIYRRNPEFLRYFFWEHNVMRFVQPFDHLQPLWYYAPILFAGLLPGTLFFVPYFRRLSGSTTEHRPFSAAGGFWLVAGAWCVAFFSVSGSKLPTYILPAYPFLCLALGDYLARSHWNGKRFPRMAIAMMAAIMLAIIHVGVPWYARIRSPYVQPDAVMKYLDDTATPVITYPRNCDSLAYYSGRADFDRVRSKGVNELIVAMHHRPRTVMLFTHRHSFEAFIQALPSSLAVREHVSFKRDAHGMLGKIAGDSPWGLADLAVITPVQARAQRP